MVHGKKTRRSVYKLKYNTDICGNNNQSVNLFRVSLPFNTTAHLSLDLSVYDINTSMCNIYNISNCFKFINGVLTQIGNNDMIAFEETTAITIHYNIYYNNIYICF